MTIRRFAVLGAFSLAIAACGGREEDTLGNETEMQAEDLNALADEAAMEAENEALGSELPAVEAPAPEPVAEPEGESVDTAPSDVEDDVPGL